MTASPYRISPPRPESRLSQPSWLHRLAHLLRWYRTVEVSAKSPNGELWVGQRCTVCGKEEGWFNFSRFIWDRTWRGDIKSTVEAARWARRFSRPHSQKG
jgi:hypothetical protein